MCFRTAKRLSVFVLTALCLSLLCLPAIASENIDETISTKAGETPLVNVIEPEDPADPAAVGEEPMEAAPEEDSRGA